MRCQDWSDIARAPAALARGARTTGRARRWERACAPSSSRGWPANPAKAGSRCGQTPGEPLIGHTQPAMPALSGASVARTPAPPEKAAGSCADRPPTGAGAARASRPTRRAAAKLPPRRRPPLRDPCHPGPDARGGSPATSAVSWPKEVRAMPRSAWRFRGRIRADPEPAGGANPSPRQQGMPCRPRGRRAARKLAQKRTELPRTGPCRVTSHSKSLRS